jgi:signal transduction histidine kinase
MIHVLVKALVPIRMSVMWKFYTGNRPEKHLSSNRCQALKLDVERGCRLETHDPCAGSMKDKIWDMKVTGERQPNTLVRSQLGWTKVTAFAALSTAALFAVLNWHGCWLFRYEARNLAVFFYPFAWLVLFFAVRTRWRLVLLLVTIPALFVYANGRWGLSEQNSGAESAAFQALHQMQSGINASRAEHQQKRLSRHPTVNGRLAVCAKVLPFRIYSTALGKWRDCRLHHRSHSGPARLRISQELHDYR